VSGTHHLLDDPHHDGSEVYVPRATPQLGDVVPVRFRVPAAGTERALWARTVRDGEPRLVPARLDRADAHKRWYVAENLYGGADLPVRAGALHLPGDGPGVQVWRLA